MAQEYIKFRKKQTDAWTIPVQPDEGMAFNFETTYTEDSTRVQTGKGHFSAMFTVESYGYQASDVSKSQMQQILQIILPGSSFFMWYYSAYYGTWREDEFYVGKGSMEIGRLTENDEKFESLSFNIVGVNPIV